MKFIKSLNETLTFNEKRFTLTCRRCCSAAPSLRHCGPLGLHSFHSLHKHSTSLHQTKIEKTIINDSEQQHATCTSVMINILQISLSNPDEASVAPLG